jgi:uncharacterized protein (DUF924 family)
MQATGSEHQAVLDFWFGAPGTSEYGTQRKAWFVKNADFDHQIRGRFLGLHVRAHAGELAHWEDQPDSLLALIIVLDQFSRNLFRQRAQAFASDARALACARLMVARGWDMRLLPVQRGFVYLPYEHAEDLAVQDEAVRLFERVLEDPLLAELPVWARKHHDVIRRFGRFPHRNQILGRPSTEEELAFLRQPGSRF